MSNKRNQRRIGQRVRSEIDRTPKPNRKSTVAFLAALPADRKRKEQERYLKHLTKKERRERELQPCLSG